MKCPTCTEEMQYKNQDFVIHAYVCKNSHYARCDKDCCACQRCGNYLKWIHRSNYTKENPYIKGLCPDETCGFATHERDCKAGFNSHPDYPISPCICKERK